MAAAGLAVIFLGPASAMAINCEVTVGPLDFGVYMPLTPTPVDVIGQFDVRCVANAGSYRDKPIVTPCFQVASAASTDLNRIYR